MDMVTVLNNSLNFSLLVSGLTSLSACVRSHGGHGYSAQQLVELLSACVGSHFSLCLCQVSLLSLLASGLTVDMLSTFCDAFMVQCMR